MIKKGLIGLLMVLVLAIAASAAFVSDIAYIGATPSSGSTDYDGLVEYEFSTANTSYVGCALMTNETTGTLAVTTFTDDDLTDITSGGLVVGKKGNISRTYTSDVSHNWTIGCRTSTGGNYDDFQSTDARLLTVDLNTAPQFNVTTFLASITSPIDLDEDNSSKTHAQAIEGYDDDGHSISFSVGHENTSEVDCTVSGSTLSYQPASNFAGSATCNVTVTDSPPNHPALSTNAVVTFDVQQINDAPSFSDFSVSMLENATLSSIEMSGNVTDVDDVGFTYNVVSEDTAKADCSVSSSQLTVQATNGYSGSATCIIQVTDLNAAGAGSNGALSDNATVTISIEGETKAGTITTDSETLVRTTPASALSGTIEMNITNSGNVQLTSLSVDTTEDTIENAKGNLTLGTATLSSSSLAVGSVATISVPVSMTAAQSSISNDSVTYTGTVNVTGDGFEQTQTFTVTVRSAQESITMDPTSISFGSVDRNSTSDNQTFKLKNDGDTSLTGVEINYTGSKGLEFATSAAGPYDSYLSIGSLAAGVETSTLYIRANVPSSASAGSGTYDSFTVTSNQNVSASFTTTATVQSELIFDDVKVKVKNIGESAETDDDLNDGDTVSEDVKPGATVTVFAKLKNNYDDDVDEDLAEMDNFVFRIEDAYDFDDDDLEEEYSEKRDAGEKTSFIEIEFRVPFDIDEDTEELTFVGEAEDGDGNLHEVQMTIKLKGKRDSHRVVFEDARLTAEDVDACLITTTDVIAEVVNIGEEDEDVEVRFKNSELGLDETRTFELPSTEEDEDDGQKNVRVTLAVDDNVDTGNYDIDIEVRRGSTGAGSKTVTLKVVECRSAGSGSGSSGSSSGSSSSTVNVLGPGGSTGGTASGSSASVPVQTSSSEFFSDNMILVLLVLGNIVLIGGIAFVTVKFLL